MLHPPRQRAGRGARLARLLLLGLAVAACGRDGSGDTAAGDAAQARAADAGAAAQRGARPDPQCPLPPDIDTTFFTDSSWASFDKWRTGHRVRFTGREATANVPLEQGGTPVPLTIRSEHRTNCMRRDEIRGKTRIAGIFRVDGAATAFGHTFAPGDEIFVFSHDTLGRAFLAFKKGDRVGTAPAETWRFRFCHDGHPHPDPAAEWRPFDRPPNGPPGEEDPGTYGWMACASGCCQFYIPPKDPEDPGDKGAGRPVRRDTIPVCDPVP